MTFAIGLGCMGTSGFHAPAAGAKLSPTELAGTRYPDAGFVGIEG